MKKFKLTRSKSRALSMILANFSEVLLASMVIPVFISGLDRSNPLMVVFGLLGTIATVLLSLMFAEKGKL